MGDVEEYAYGSIFCKACGSTPVPGGAFLWKRNGAVISAILSATVIIRSRPCPRCGGVRLLRLSPAGREVVDMAVWADAPPT